MNDECQPTFCDCEGFCTGACRLRKLERDIAEQRRYRQDLKKTISRANDEIIRVTDSICALERTYSELLERFK
jgi:septal ring factor EnvC (AmiA/AmiB activator)